MTASNIPDSFNLDELSSLLENAPQEEELHSENADKEITPEFIEGIANEALQLAGAIERSPCSQGDGYEGYAQYDPMAQSHR